MQQNTINCVHYFSTLQIFFTIIRSQILFTWQSVMWTNSSTWQIFLHGHRSWCPWQIWGMAGTPLSILPASPLVDARASFLRCGAHWDNLSSAPPTYCSPCWCPSLHVLHTLYIDKFSPALPSYSCILYIYVAHWDKLSSALPTSPLVDAPASFIHGIHTVTVVCTLRQIVAPNLLLHSYCAHCTLRQIVNVDSCASFLHGTFHVLRQIDVSVTDSVTLSSSDLTLVVQLTMRV